MSTAVGTGAVDCDVHCAPAHLDELGGSFDGYWRGYVRDAGLALSPTQAGAYPPGAPTSATPAAREAGLLPAAGTVDALRDALLDPAGLRTAVLSCTSAFPVNRNPYYEAALTRAVNDWLLERWLARDDRLRASIVVPTLDTRAAVAEIERVGSHPGVVQVLLPVRTDAPWGNVRHRPVLEAAAEHGLVVGLHAWGRAGQAGTPSGLTHTYVEDYLTNSQVAAQAQLTSLVTEGAFAAVPELRVTLVECGFSWLPALLWRFDKDWKGVWREVPWVAGRPSEIVREHVRFTTAPAALPPDPARIREVLELLGGTDALLWASDHPHDHGPGGRWLLDALTDDERAAVTRDNAVAWYRL
ncbi:hydrolase [Actinomycetospora sp. NBRC 106375]|uniref:amidohydrolase family protein n=1 Tax=Actinomycetospora sp. NBRC 106375 TaxID=3032207 RepID=UPI0024A0E409|nr:amidohydrolase family protein [Actinomycetospora sp. NBRC 106375]GLZ47875.1 hydrolase [Actinomycetospora sp. NBRC 106375]